MKRFISMVLAFVMVLGIVPVGEMVVFADPVDPVVVSITVNKVYTNFTGPDRFLIDVRGEGFLDASKKLNIDIGISGSDGKFKAFTPVYLTDGIVQYELTPNEIDKEIVIGSQTIRIDKTDIPSIEGKTPINGVVVGDEPADDYAKSEVTLTGKGFENIKASKDATEGVKASFYGGSTTIDILKGTSAPDIDVKSDTEIKTKKLQGQTGSWGIIFEKEYETEPFKQKGGASGSEKPLKLFVQHRYLDVFSLLSTLKVKEPLEMIPTRGPLGTYVKIESPQLYKEADMSVFFVKSLNDEYTLDNMSKEENYIRDEVRKKDIFTIKVPETLKKQYKTYTGQYYVVLTNNIDPVKGNPKVDIKSRKILSTKFTVIDDEDSVKIESIEPNTGSAVGNVKATIKGRYIGSMSSNVYSPPKDAEGKEIPNYYNIEDPKGGNTLTVKYTGGNYKLLGDEGIDVVSIERKVKFLIGNGATFENGSTLNPSGLDEIKVLVPPSTTEKEDPVKDVVVTVNTTVTYLDEDGEEVTVDIVEEDILEKGFTYQPISYTPKINEVVPDKIPVDDKNKTSVDLDVSIYGENFSVHRYVGKDENGKDIFKYKYPIINFGNQIILNKNDPNSTANIKIFDKNGKQIDGTQGNDRGVRIVVTVPIGKEIDGDSINKDSFVRVINPIKNSEEIKPTATVGEFTNMGSADQKLIRFVRVGDNKMPKITDVIPYERTANSPKSETITLKGLNFDKTAKVYLDGKEITSVTRDDIGREIYFKEPVNMPEGKYQIIVQNEEGGLGTADIMYVKGNSNPKIIDFNPKEGTNGTPVYIKGEGILGPNPQVENPEDELNSYKFIGSRILFQKEGTNIKIDMNQYNYKDKSKVIELRDYRNKGKDIIYKKEGLGGLELADYYQSIIFEGGTNNYFVLEDDRVENKITLTNKVGIKYDFELKNGEIIANKEGGANGISFEITADSSSSYLEIDGLKLKMRTPYAMDSEGNIVGHKVKVINQNELIFDVNLLPQKEGEEIQNGEYKISIRNPGVESDQAKDKFKYKAQPESKPKITVIEPVNEGTSEGGYKRTIKGEQFREGIKVYIGEKEISEKDVTFISKEEIAVVIPKYEGKDIDKTSDGRKKLPLSVLNPDGGTSTYDFIYVNPNSKPVIDSIASDFGPVSGGVEVTIYEDKEFRFYEPYRGDVQPKTGDEWFQPYDVNGNGIYDSLIRNTKNPKNKYDLEREKDGFVGEKYKLYPDELAVLPKVWFGDEQAKVIRYDSEGKNSKGKRTITVEIPKGIQGKTSIYLENNDFGVSNKVDFEYQKTDIGNIEIKPGMGKKQGNTSAEIRATGKDKKNVFTESEINVFKQDGTGSKVTKQLVRFSKKDDLNMSNASINGSMAEAIKENSGRIVNEVSDVTVGNLRVDYTKDNDKEIMKFKLIDQVYDSKDKEFKDIEYEFTANFPKEADEVYLPINLLKNEKGNYGGFELVKISKGRFTIDGKLSNVDKLTLERGYSPEANVRNKGEYIELKAPSYYSVGEVDVTVINIDGSEASTKYIYTNPSNSPVITDVFREGNPTTDKEKASGKKVIKVDYRGGVKIHIMGRDFRKPSRIDIGGSIHVQGEKIGDDKKGIDHFPQVEDREDYEELVFVMPEVPEDYVGKEYAFIVTTPYDDAKEGGNLNSATTSSSDGQFKIYVEFTKGETNPKITKLTPNKGPSSGGTKVTIEGEDFRKQDPESGMYGELRVRVAGKEIDKDKIQFVNSKKLIITTPPNESGEVKIEVENPDGSIAKAEKDGDDKYTYVSNPKITNIVDPENGDVKKESLSIEGGETIKIIGSDFQEGAEVIFSPILKKASEDPTSTEKRIFINGVEYIYKPGIAAQLVEFIDSNNIKVVTPAGKLDTGDVIVINKDGAATPIYSLKYTIPEISYPREVRASLINDEYIRINWDEVTDKATADDGKTVQYEVYVIEGNSREFIGTTGTTGFIFRDIKRNKTTEFQFLVRSVGKYGSSKPIEESTSNTVKVSRNAGPVDNDGKPGEKTKVEKIGDTANIVIGEDALKGVSEYVIDLTRGNLAGSEKVVVSISAETVVSERNKKIKIVGKDYGLSFSPNVFENATVIANRNNINAGVKLEVLPTNTNFDLAQNNGDTILASKYYLRGRTFVGANSNEIENLNGVMNFALDYDNSMAKARRLENNIKIVRYDQYARRFEEIRSNSNYGTSLGNISKLGIYTIVGSRR